LKARGGATERHYSECRQRAADCDAMMRACFEQASNAFNHGHGKEAKELSRQGKQYQRERDEWQAKAAEMTVQNMNSDNSSYFPLDMHGLRVDEAIGVLKQLIASLARVPGKKTLHIITGKGNHSGQQGPRVKRSVEQFLAERSIFFNVPDDNPGCIYAYLEGKRGYLSG